MVTVILLAVPLLFMPVEQLSELICRNMVMVTTRHFNIYKGRPGNSLWTNIYNKIVYSCFSKFSTCLNNVGDVKMVPNKLMQLLTSLRDTSLSFWGRFAVCTFSQPPPCRCFSMVGPLGRFPPALLGSLSDPRWPSSVWQGGLKTPKMGPQILFVDLQSECGECNQLVVYM